MVPAFCILLVLLLSAALDPLTASGLLTGLRLLLAGAGLGLCLREIQPGEGAHLFRVLRLWVPGLGLACAWLVVQLLPLPAGLAHSVWSSAAAALGSSLVGTITIDVGATIRMIDHVLLFGATAALASAVLIDRVRAEWGLATLTVGAVLLAVLGWGLAPAEAGAVPGDAAFFGFLLALACAYLFYERYETRHARQSHALLRFLAILAAALVAVLVCGTLVFWFGTPGERGAAGAGTALLLAIVLVRRLGIGLWTALAVGLIVCIGAVIAGANAEGGGSIVLAFTNAPAALQAMTRRMMEDAPWVVGTGGGTSGALSGLYRGFDDPPVYAAPSLAAALAIELGRPAALLLLLAGLGAVAFFVRKAFSRGRDSVYAAAGAGVLTGAILLAFVGTGLRGEGVSLVLAGVVGLALAQSESRRA